MVVIKVNTKTLEFSLTSANLKKSSQDIDKKQYIIFALGSSSFALANLKVKFWTRRSFEWERVVSSTWREPETGSESLYQIIRRRFYWYIPTTEHDCRADKNGETKEAQFLREILKTAILPRAAEGIRKSS